MQDATRIAIGEYIVDVKVRHKDHRCASKKQAYILLNRLVYHLYSSGDLFKTKGCPTIAEEACDAARAIYAKLEADGYYEKQ